MQNVGSKILIDIFRNRHIIHEFILKTYACLVLVRSADYYLDKLGTTNYTFD
jgi:hypothetical protein